jgi:hypothetical protein
MSITLKYGKREMFFMEMKSLTVSLFLVLSFEVCLGQSSYKGLTPGKSRRVEVERVLGQPVKQVSETLVEHKPQPMTGRIYVQYRKGSVVMERIEFICRLPNSSCNDFMKSLHIRLPEIATDGTPENEKGRYVIYTSSPHYVAESFDGESELENGRLVPSRVAFYSRELYETAVAEAKEATQVAEVKAEESRQKPPPLSGTYGEVTGIVKLKAMDGSSQPVAGATVDFYRLDNVPGQFQTKTNRYGTFQYQGLAPTGKWLIVISGAGIKWTYLSGVRTPAGGLEILAEPGDGARPTREQALAEIK